MSNDGNSVRDLAREFLRSIEAAPRAPTFVIACSKAKASHASPARTLYRSGRFRVQLRIAEAFSNQLFVLSGKHGVVGIDERLKPYDVTWPHGIFAKGADIPNLEHLPRGPVVFFGGNRYLDVLRRALPRRTIVAPFEKLNSFQTALWCRIVEDVLYRRERGYDFYRELETVVAISGLHHFADFSSLKTIPSMGLYYFFDPAQPTAFSRVLPRVVRVGTHAVSLGSKSTLRTRLRAHFGQQDHSGNHRASIFRLHVGNALLRKSRRSSAYPDWGMGMSADRKTRDFEKDIETKVSRYLARLQVTFVALGDAASPRSQRSVLERASINFLGGDGIALEEPTSDWLGNFSKSAIIRETGIWNIQHNGERFDRSSLKIIEQILRNPIFDGM